METVSFEELIKNNKLYRFKLELEHTHDIQRKQLLNAIINNITNSNSNPTNLERFHNMLLKCDTVIAKKPFHRLSVFQKKVIIKEYLISYLTDNKIKQDNIDKLVDDVMDLIKNKKINSKNLQFDDNQKLINITKIKIEEDKVTFVSKKQLT